MYKLLSLLTVVFVLFSFVACGGSEKTVDTVSVPSEVSETEFKVPENYSTVLLVTINPQFRLYLDAEGNVLAVEPVNDDAKSIKDNIVVENESYESVVEKIVTASKDGGFIKEESEIEIEISIVETQQEVKEETKQEIKTAVEEKVHETAEKLHIEVNVKVTEVSKDTASSDATLSDTTSSDTASAEPEPEPPTETKPVHTHSFSAATCTEAKKCACGATEGTALGHDYKEGVCSRCSAKDPDYKPTSVLKKNGKWVGNYISDINDGRLYNIVVTTCKGFGDGDGFTYTAGGPLKELSDNVEIDPTIEIITYNGVEYYMGLGDGMDMEVTESGNTVKLVNDGDDDNKENDDILVFERTGENTIKVTSYSGWFFEKLTAVPVGTVLTFTAE